MPKPPVKTSKVVILSALVVGVSALVGCAAEDTALETGGDELGGQVVRPAVVSQAVTVSGRRASASPLAELDVIELIVESAGLPKTNSGSASVRLRRRLATGEGAQPTFPIFMESDAMKISWKGNNILASGLIDVVRGPARIKTLERIAVRVSTADRSFRISAAPSTLLELGLAEAGAIIPAAREAFEPNIVFPDPIAGTWIKANSGYRLLTGPTQIIFNGAKIAAPYSFDSIGSANILMKATS